MNQATWRSRSRTEHPVWGYLLVAVIVMSVPQFAGPYAVSTATSVLMFAVPAMGAWLLLNTGIWSFGQGAWALVGSYLTTIAVMDLGLPFWLMLPVAALVAAGVAWSVSMLMLRTSGVTFAILSLVVLLTVNQLITLFPDVTRGQGGIIGVPRPPTIAIGSIEVRLSTPTAMYYFIGIMAVLVLGWLLLVWRSPYARVLVAIRDEPALAASLGVGVRRYQAAIYALAGFWTALAGGFSASYLGVAHPAVWGMFPSIFVVAYAIIGGIRSPYGPLVGAALVVTGGEVFRAADDLQPLLIGLGLVVVSVLLPTGVLGVLGRLVNLVTSSFRGPDRTTGRRPPPTDAGAAVSREP